MAILKLNGTSKRAEPKGITIVESIEIRGPHLAQVGLAKRREAAKIAQRNRAERESAA